MRDRTTADPATMLARSAEALLRRLDVVSKALEPIYQSAWIHGVKYQGPTYLREQRALERALRKYRKTKPPVRPLRKRPSE